MDKLNSAADDLERVDVELPHSLLHQAGVSFERACFERPLSASEARDDNNEQSFETDLSDGPEGDVEETTNPT